MTEKFPIRHDFHPVHHSGNVRRAAKIWIVMHSIESTNLDGAAEGAGSWFENRASGGSTQYGCDNDSIQQYLPDECVAWGAPSANIEGVHIEQMGTYRWTEKDWLKKAPGTLHRAAFLIAKIHDSFAIPIRTVSDSDLRDHAKCVTTHNQVTRAFKRYGGHTDPGPGYPMDYVLELAKEYAGDGIDIMRLKKAMLTFAQKNDIKIPSDFAMNDSWGPSAMTLAWRVSARIKSIRQTSKASIEFYKAMVK